MDKARERILLTGMVFHGYHGVLPEEQAHGQPFVVDVEMACDLEEACHTDDLSKTVDYREIYARVREVVEGGRFSLLEALTEAIADRLLSLPLVESVCVRVHKPRARLGGIVGDVAVEVHRVRGARG
ncbi:MAG: dihydroneopterin aldolase [Armatimonadota bacterium]|nr:dihydroneopterin aldolase [Armatimonadota bacterium]MDR5703919.1 dihydroneopterin aldolase [Armatimonadota bacterium]MDR7434170.1 dihydroneopterin aldolase [Armatimonadota bacterium]